MAQIARQMRQQQQQQEQQDPMMQTPPSPNLQEMAQQLDKGMQLLQSFQQQNLGATNV